MCADIEGIHEWIQELNREVFGKRDCFMVGEGAGINNNNALPYIQADRKEQPAIMDGDLKFLLEQDQQILMYLRRCEKQTMLVITNYSGEEATWTVPEEIKGKTWNRILTNVPENVPSVTDGRTLLPWETEVYISGE